MSADPLDDPGLFAARLRELMAAAGLNGAEVARRIGSHPTTVSRWRTGEDRPRPDAVARLADILGVDRMALLRDAGYADLDGARTDAPDPLEQYIREGARQMHELLDGIPRVYWPTIVRKAFDRAIDGARDMAQLLADQQSREHPVRRRADGSAKAAPARPNYGGEPDTDQLKTRQRVVGLALAGT